MFDVIVHGCTCQMGKGIALAMMTSCQASSIVMWSSRPHSGDAAFFGSIGVRGR
jgi:hypothetical protein